MKTKQILIRVTPEEREMIKRESTDQGISMSEFIMYCVLWKIEHGFTEIPGEKPSKASPPESPTTIVCQGRHAEEAKKILDAELKFHRCMASFCNAEGEALLTSSGNKVYLCKKHSHLVGL